MCMVRVSKTKFIVDFWVYFCIRSIRNLYFPRAKLHLYFTILFVLEIFSGYTTV